MTRGYLGHPTVVNNVETFAHVARILDRGAEWFHAMGTDKSHGTKLFSISGDCARPGVYELPYGLPLRAFLSLAGAEDAAAVQVGGPSGTLVGRDSFDRCLSFEDLATGGAVIVFSSRRNILEIVDYYLSFFVHESCGYCTPCRVGNVFLKKAIEKFRKGQANDGDIAYLKDLSATIIETSRCGLGQTSPNPVLIQPAKFSAGLFGADQAQQGRHQGQNFRHSIRHRRLRAASPSGGPTFTTGISASQGISANDRNLSLLHRRGRGHGHPRPDHHASRRCCRYLHSRACAMWKACAIRAAAGSAL